MPSCDLIMVNNPPGKFQEMFEKFNGFAYGYPEPSTSLNESIQSSYEAISESESQYFSTKSSNSIDNCSSNNLQIADIVQSHRNMSPLKPKRISALKNCQSTPIKPTGIISPLKKGPTTSSNDKIAKVVHEIVLEKYESSYNQLLKKLKKLELSLFENKYRYVVAELKELFSTIEGGSSFEVLKCANKDFYKEFVQELPGKGQDSTCQVYTCLAEPDSNHSVYHSLTDQKSNDEASEFKTCMEEKDNSTKLLGSESNQSSDYDECQFLQNALEGLNKNAELYISPPTVSVGTEDVSTLISRTSLSPFKEEQISKTKKKIAKLLSNISRWYDDITFKSHRICDTNQESRSFRSSPDLVSDPFRYSYASYEDVTNLGYEIYSDEGKKQIKKHIFINERIIEQTENMLKYGQKQTVNFVGSHAHLEGARILILSKMRRQVLINHLYRIPDTPKETTARVTFENLRILLNNEQPNLNQYYLCILQHKTTVYSSRIAAPNRLGWVDLGGLFIFDNVCNTFDIKVELYCLTVPKNGQSCFVITNTRKLPLMQQTGEVHIGLLNSKNKKFTFKNSNVDKGKEHKLAVSIDIELIWPETLKGFLTLGNRKMDRNPLWNRRWCVLEGTTLKYYNYPSDEHFGLSIGQIDLKHCKTCEISEFKYLKQRTLKLMLKEKEGQCQQTVYISADSEVEHRLWSGRVRLILEFLRDWEATAIE